MSNEQMMFIGALQFLLGLMAKMNNGRLRTIEKKLDMLLDTQSNMRVEINDLKNKTTYLEQQLQKMRATA